MRRCWDDPSYNFYGHALEGAVGGGQWQPLLVHVDHPVQKVNTKDFEWKHDFRAWKGRGERRREGWRRGCHIVVATAENRWKLTWCWLPIYLLVLTLSGWPLVGALFPHSLSSWKEYTRKAYQVQNLPQHAKYEIAFKVKAPVVTFSPLSLDLGPCPGGSTAGWWWKTASWKQLERLFRCFTMQGFYPQLPQSYNNSS